MIRHKEGLKKGQISRLSRMLGCSWMEIQIVPVLHCTVCYIAIHVTYHYMLHCITCYFSVTCNFLWSILPWYREGLWWALSLNPLIALSKTLWSQSLMSKTIWFSLPILQAKQQAVCTLGDKEANIKVSELNLLCMRNISQLTILTSHRPQTDAQHTEIVPVPMLLKQSENQLPAYLQSGGKEEEERKKSKSQR